MSYLDYARQQHGSNLVAVLEDAKNGLLEEKRRWNAMQEANRRINTLQTECNRIKNQVNRSAASKTIKILTVIYLVLWIIHIIDWFLLTLVFGISVWYVAHKAGEKDRKENAAKYEAEAKEYYDKNYPPIYQEKCKADALWEAIRYYEPFQHACEILRNEYWDITVVDQLISIATFRADQLTDVFAIYQDDVHKRFLEKQAQLGAEAAQEQALYMRQRNEEERQHHQMLIKNQREWMNTYTNLTKERNQIERDKQRAAERYYNGY